MQFQILFTDLKDLLWTNIHNSFASQFFSLDWGEWNSFSNVEDEGFFQGDLSSDSNLETYRIPHSRLHILEFPWWELEIPDDEMIKAIVFNALRKFESSAIQY
ncbi:hypothetical protein BK146_24655 [Paenibacillus sp. FSL R7-0333]|nr:hypothetical protein BK146_24655 [Paenibacillus sp. FSL R7-0333]